VGQKIHPNSIRLGYIHNWNSVWFSLRDMPALINEDHRIRQIVRERFRLAAVSYVVIERAGAHLRVIIHTAKPGIVIGKKGVDIEAIRTAIEKMTGRQTYIDVKEIKDPELDARLVAEAVALQLERRIGHRRAMKRAIERTLQAGALGIKLQVGGRLGGSEIARREWMREGRVPLHTFSADIDYGQYTANTTMGTIGVKCWIFKKMLFKRTTQELLAAAKKAQEEAPEAVAAAAEVPAAAEAVPAAEPEEEIPAIRTLEE
jgi:small subunit ribosomal protein S3